MGSRRLDLKALSAEPATFLMITALLCVGLGASLEGLPAVIILHLNVPPGCETAQHRPHSFSIVVIAATSIGLFPPPIGIGPSASRGIAGIGLDRVLQLPYNALLCLGLLMLLLPRGLCAFSRSMRRGGAGTWWHRACCWLLRAAQINPR